MVTSVASMISQFNLPNIKLLIEMGYVVTVATNFTEPGNIPVESSKKLMSDLNSWGVDTIDIPFARSPLRKDNVSAFKILEKIILEGNFNKIHCQTPIGGALTRFVKMKNRNIGAEIIYTAHGFHFYKGAPIKKWIIFYTIEKLLSRYTDKLITINEEDYNYSKKMKAKENIYVPGVGINLEKFTVSSPSEIANKRKELNIPDNNLVLLSIGELSDRKNHRVVIESLKLFSSINITYLICGQGYLLEDLEDLVKDYKLEDNVKFLGFRNDINEICNAADIFIFPSIHEGLPVSVMEAMACGLPVVGSKIRGNTDLIVQDKGGYLGKNSPEFYYESIKKYINNPNLAEVQGEYNLDKIKNFSINKVMDSMKQIYCD